MPKALKSHSHTLVVRIPISHFHSSPLWVNKNWPRVKRLKKVKHLWYKLGLPSCKWSNLNAPGTQNPLPGSGWENSIYSFFWGLKEMGSPAWRSKFGKYSEQNWLNRVQMVQFECPKHPNPCLSLRLGGFHFLIFLGNKGNGLPSMNVKSWKNFIAKLAHRLQMV